MSDTQEKLQTNSENLLSTVWLKTKLGQGYALADMLPGHVDTALKQLHEGDDGKDITMTNVSGAVLVLPYRILKEAGVHKEGQPEGRACWEVK